MIEDDTTYYRRRAEIEQAQARHATCAQAARAHSQLANAYLGRIASAEPVRQMIHA